MIKKKRLSLQPGTLTKWVYLVLLTGQFHHFMAFNRDLLTSCWLVFSSQWPAAISLVITSPKKATEPDNARELYMSLVSSPAKNRTSPLSEISACLQWRGHHGPRGWACVCPYTSMPIGGCGCACKKAFGAHRMMCVSNIYNKDMPCRSHISIRFTELLKKRKRVRFVLRRCNVLQKCFNHSALMSTFRY